MTICIYSFNIFSAQSRFDSFLSGLHETDGDIPVLSNILPLFLAARADQIAAGDVIQLQNSSGDFYHTLIISGFTDSDVLVCAQSNDALDRPLSSYNYSGLRVIHIEGARIDIDTENSFRNILDGTAILPISENS